VQKLVSKYALAAHLAILAVAPLFLLPFAGERVTAVVLLWLAGFGFIWLLMEPSRRRGEMPHNARERVVRAMLRDPLFWFSLVLVAYAGIRAVNGGIGIMYDAEQTVWSIRLPTWPMLPGCVDGTGGFAFSSVLALAIVMQGLLHALGRSARGAFLVVGAVASAAAALALACAVSSDHAGSLAMSAFSVRSASYFGTAFGIQLLVSLAALFAAVENGWMKAEPLVALALVGNAIGLVTFSPMPTISVFAILFLLATVVSFVLTRHVIGHAGSFRCALAVLMTLVAPVIYALAMGTTAGMSAKVAAFQTFQPFPEDFFVLRDNLSSIALSTWKASPWLGTGLASFPFDIRFAATSEHWEVIDALQATALNGWWQMLVERGVIGALMIAVTLAMLLWTFVTRLVKSFREVRFAPEHVVGLLAAVSLVPLSFVDCSLLRPEVLLLAGAALALSCGAMPEHASHKGEG